MEIGLRGLGLGIWIEGFKAQGKRFLGMKGVGFRASGFGIELWGLGLRRGHGDHWRVQGFSGLLGQ